MPNFPPNNQTIKQTQGPPDEVILVLCTDTSQVIAHAVVIRFQMFPVPRMTVTNVDVPGNFDCILNHIDISNLMYCLDNALS